MFSNAWVVLAVVVLARTAFGLQYQSVGAVGPELIAGLGLNFTALGTLIGAYSTLGLFLAMPAGWMIARFGDRLVLAMGLALMVAGGALLASASGFEVALIGRVASGTGSVLVVVVAPKMVLDRFTGGRLLLAMGSIVSAYPLGIGLAVMGLPLLGGWRDALWAVVAVCAAGLAAACTTPGPVASGLGGPGRLTWLDRRTGVQLVFAGLIWSFFNAGYGVLLGFAPAWLVTQGIDRPTAGGLVSLAAFTTVPLGPLGGWLMGKLGRPMLGIGLSLAAMGAAMLLLTAGALPAVLLFALGCLVGFSAGPMMSLPGEILAPRHRALGMGLFYAIYYGGMTVLPPLAGLAGDLSHSAAAPIATAAGFDVCAIMALLAYARSRRAV